MAPYTQTQLEAMLADLESDLVERKESLQGDNPRKIQQAVCAFANDLPDHQCPGVVFVGANDAGAPVGLAITDDLLLQLADVKTDGNILPPPTLTVDRRVLLGTPVAVVTVMPSDTPPVRHRGRIYRCVEPLTRVGDIGDPALRRPADGLHLLAGDLAPVRLRGPAVHRMAELSGKREPVPGVSSRDRVLNTASPP